VTIILQIIGDWEEMLNVVNYDDHIMNNCEQREYKDEERYYWYIMKYIQKYSSE